MKKKVLIISGGMLPVPAKLGGAVETLIDYLIEENAKTGDLEIDVVTCGDRNGFTETDGTASYIRIAYPRIIQIADNLLYFYSGKIKKDWKCMFLRNKYKERWYRRKIRERVDISKYEAVVVENNMSLLDMLSAEMGETFSRKCYYHMHSVLIDNRAMIPYLAACKKILTVSDYVTEELKKTVPEFRDTVIEKVQNGIKCSGRSKEYYMRARAELREKYNISDDTCVFLYSGRLSMEKGPMELLLAYEKADLRGCVLLYAGAALSGSSDTTFYAENMKKYAEHMEQRVIFTGYIDHDNMMELYHTADALVIPSIVGDAAPLTLLEAMACGLPIIAARVGGMPEYARDYRTVYWAEPGEQFVEELKTRLETFAAEYSRRKKNGSVSRTDPDTRFDTKTYYESFCGAITEQKREDGR